MHLVLTAADAATAAAAVGHNLMLASGHHHPPADLMLPPPSHKMENMFSHFIKPIQDHAKGCDHGLVCAHFTVFITIPAMVSY